MRLSVSILSLVAAFAAIVVCGGEAQIDLQSWDGQSELPGGWTQTNLKKSSTYNNGAQFSGADYSLTSPPFTGIVQTVSVRLTCNTNNPARILKLIPILPDGTEGEPQDFNRPETAKSYEWQVKDIETCGVDQFRIGLSSGNTGYWYVLSVKATYDETNPIVRPDPVEPEPVEEQGLISNCWKVSEFTRMKGGRCFHDADFSYLATVKKETNWVNGVSVDSFYSFDGGKPSSKIRVATSNSTYHALYAIHAEDETGQAVDALGLMSMRDAGMEMLLPVELDSERRIRGVAVSFHGWEPKVGTAATTLEFAWCAVNSLDAILDGEWTATPEGNYSGGEDALMKSVTIPGRSIKEAKYICLRWSIAKHANSSLLGISDLRVTADLDQSGFAVLLR